jgi:Protein of unknown function (DUF2806)
MTAAAVEYIEANSLAIGERALQHGVQRIVKQQFNRETVVLKTLENLHRDPPHEAPTEVPSDWLNLFGSYAERASSEKLREHWSAILEGEIRKPGAFSFATLQLASILDERLASTIEGMRPWILESCIPLIGELAEDAQYKNVLSLTGIGFVVLTGASLVFAPDENEDVISIALDAGTIYINNTRRIKPFQFGFQAAMLTRAGEELLAALAPAGQSPKLAISIMEHLATEGYKEVTFVPR